MVLIFSQHVALEIFGCLFWCEIVLNFLGEGGVQYSSCSVTDLPCVLVPQSVQECGRLVYAISWFCFSLPFYLDPVFPESLWSPSCLILISFLAVFLNSGNLSWERALVFQIWESIGSQLLWTFLLLPAVLLLISCWGHLLLKFQLMFSTLSVLITGEHLGYFDIL